MARVTVEDCLEKVPNRFALTVLGSRRARALSEGKGTALVKSTNKVGVVALREIAKGAVRYEEVVEDTIRSCRRIIEIIEDLAKYPVPENSPCSSKLRSPRFA